MGSMYLKVDSALKSINGEAVRWYKFELCVKALVKHACVAQKRNW